MREGNQVPGAFVEFGESWPGAGLVDVVSNFGEDLLKIGFVMDFAVNMPVRGHRATSSKRKDREKHNAARVPLGGPLVLVIPISSVAVVIVRIGSAVALVSIAPRIRIPVMVIIRAAIVVVVAPIMMMMIPPIMMTLPSGRNRSGKKDSQ